jgi:hypothetical protein
VHYGMTAPFETICRGPRAASCDNFWMLDVQVTRNGVSADYMPNPQRPSMLTGLLLALSSPKAATPLHSRSSLTRAAACEHATRRANSPVSITDTRLAMRPDRGGVGPQRFLFRSRSSAGGRNRNGDPDRPAPLPARSQGKKVTSEVTSSQPIRRCDFHELIFSTST